MIITLRTKQYVILAALLAATATMAAAYLVVQVQKQAALLEIGLQEIAEGNARSVAAAAVSRQITETHDDRALLAGAFLTSIDEDGGSFLTELETLAATMGLSMSIISITDEPSQSAEGKEEIKIVFSYAGTEQVATAFALMLESLPYHGRLERLTISVDKSSREAKAEAELRVTVYPSV